MHEKNSTTMKQSSKSLHINIIIRIDKPSRREEPESGSSFFHHTATDQFSTNHMMSSYNSSVTTPIICATLAYHFRQMRIPQARGVSSFLLAWAGNARYSIVEKNSESVCRIFNYSSFFLRYICRKFRL